jgi:hypothetical protein
LGDSRDGYDIAFEEGVANWNLLAFNAYSRSESFWEIALLLPNTKPACAEYARTRYLGLLSDEALFARYRTLQVGTMEMDDEGYLTPAKWNGWRDKWIHAAMEITLRGLSMNDERTKPDWSFGRTPLMLRAVAARSRRKLSWGRKLLVKYGSRRFLRAALEDGVIRISRASSYDDPSLNAARRDRELQRDLIDSAFETTATLGPIGNTASEDERQLYAKTVESAIDYYIFCLAGGCELRLFDDFEADACLVITEPERFAASLGEAAAHQLPGWHYGCQFVRYFDPVQRLTEVERFNSQVFAPFFSKDFRYAYQREVRAAWLPPDPEAPRSPFDHLFLTLGALKDYCELIEL